jgi:hypothetical protein
LEPALIAIIQSGELDKKARIWKKGFPKWILLENAWFVKFLPGQGPQLKDEAKTPPDADRENGMVDFEGALRILGLKRGFSEADLKKAYNKAVKMNHPDKAAHLDIEFRELAERKTKQINRANELLRLRFE